MSYPNPAIQAALDKIFARAATDRGYRQRLLKDPRKAVTEETGTPLPSSTNVKFIEKEAGYDVVFVLPDFVDPEVELSAEQLETVAGGAKLWCDCGASACGGSCVSN